ncbi:MAG: kelch repeat-containing protein [Candidatus Thorarchaeota archaeon]
MPDLKKYKREIFAGTILIVMTFGLVPIAYSTPRATPYTFTISEDENLPTRGNPGMAYDNESDRIVIFGGWNNTPTTAAKKDVWTYDYNNDASVRTSPSPAPDGRAEPGLAYDSSRDNIVLFGGMRDININDRLNDTWLYDTNSDTWTEVFPTSAPSERRAHDMVYDSESDRFIVFGGEDGNVLNETWSYDAGTNVWTEMNPSVAPPSRFAHKMVYDSESDRVIMFGGYDGTGANQLSNYFGDTWAYDFNTDTWSNITPSTSPSVRGVPSLTYDSESDKIILFGGSAGGTAYSDTWVFDYNTVTWTEMSPSIHPDTRSRHGSAYDWESDRVVIFGGTRLGFSSTVLITETDGMIWAYDVNANTWEEMGPTTTPTTTTPTTPATPTGNGVDWTLVYVAVGGIAVILILAVIFVRRR